MFLQKLGIKNSDTDIIEVHVGLVTRPQATHALTLSSPWILGELQRTLSLSVRFSEVLQFSGVVQHSL